LAAFGGLVVQRHRIQAVHMITNGLYPVSSHHQSRPAKRAASRQPLARARRPAPPVRPRSPVSPFV